MNFQSKNNEIVYDIVNIDGGYACYVSVHGLALHPRQRLATALGYALRLSAEAR